MISRKLYSSSRRTHTVSKRLSHSFVLVRFSFKRSALWTSHYGIEKAAALRAQPFLALRVPARDFEPEDTPYPETHAHLFLISTRKPSGISQDCYLALEPAAKEEKQTLVVNPPLPSQGKPLYVHTYPWLLEEPMLEDEGTCVKPGPHHLDEPSFRIFCRSVLEDRPRCLKLEKSQAMKLASSGGPEPVEEGWQTFSGGPANEYLNKPPWNKYDYLEFENLPIEGPPSIYKELESYERLVTEYLTAR